MINVCWGIRDVWIRLHVYTSEPSPGRSFTKRQLQKRVHIICRTTVSTVSVSEIIINVNYLLFGWMYGNSNWIDWPKFLHSEFCRCYCSFSFPFLLFFCFCFLFVFLFVCCLVVCLCFCFSYIHSFKGRGERVNLKNAQSDQFNQKLLSFA